MVQKEFSDQEKKYILEKQQEYSARESGVSENNYLTGELFLSLVDHNKTICEK